MCLGTGEVWKVVKAEQCALVQVKCGRSCKVERTLMSVPDVVSIGLIWDTDEPTTSYIKNLVEAIGVEITLADVSL